MESLITTDEAAGRIGVSPLTLTHWRRSRTGPPWAKIGRRIMYRPSDIDSWVDSRFKQAAADGASS